MRVINKNSEVVSELKNYNFRKKGFNYHNNKPYVYLAYLENNKSKQIKIEKLYINKIGFYQSSILTPETNDYLLSIYFIKNNKLKKLDEMLNVIELYRFFVNTKGKVFLSDVAHTEEEAIQKLNKREEKTKYSNLFK